MASKTILFAFGIVLLAAILQEIEAATGNVSIAVPMRRRIKGLGTRKCLVYMWDGLCENQNCTVKIERTLSKEGISNKLSTTSFKPFTKVTTQAVCYFDSGETSACCDAIFSGAKFEAQSTAFGDFYKIAFKLERERMGFKIHVQDSFMLPWKDICALKSPCNAYGSCKTEKPDTYNCTCKSNWEGKNCTERTGWKVSINRCLLDVKAVKTLSSVTLERCMKECNDSNKEKIGCKSFQFHPDDTGSSTGSCKLFDVSNIHDGKQLNTNCVTWYFDMEKLPKIKPPNTGATTSFSSVLVLTVLYVTQMAFLHI